MADIYLEHKKDRRAYARCYNELVQRHNTVESSLLLGDAYMNIQEPDKAIKVYEAALENFPGNVALASKIGKALVKTHDYGRAISYYESALEKDSSFASTLRYDLAELYNKLKNYEDVERIATESLNHQRSEDPAVLALDSKYNLLLAKATRATAKYDKAVVALQRAREIQMRIVSQLGATADSKEHKLIASDICFELADLYQMCLKEHGKALSMYNEAIQANSLNSKALLALCRLHLAQGDLIAAQTQCANMLRMEVAVDEATIIMAEVMFRRNQYDQAVFHFRQLLERQPTHYVALRKLVEMTRRSGTLHEAEPFFAAAEKATQKVFLHPGYHFCKGLYCRYTNNPNEALREFNLCRRDPEWGEEAIGHMIEIFLNPDNDTLGGDALESVTDSSQDAATAGGATAPSEQAES
ncbi:Tetratricopeptide repeat protein 21B, partial [Cladochytrium tenue]